ncbi:PREDICTED: proline-rich protein 5 isoform X1 [Mandrillus leucophaeus]|uniref:proline-rich protein 5 isoform X1 n=1 Tax=Mandrillus leucophaeus TaxID=9568 RepID=UPI0005F3907D|nr:PREDICTED: proline-rich protein 5 isoform X1 [Mandrillus leucophaeus]
MCPHTTKSGKPSLDRPSSRKPSLPDPLHPLLPWTWCYYWKWSPCLPRPDHRQPELAWPWVLRATDCGAPFPRRLSLCLLGGGQSLLATALMILLSVPLPCHVMDQWLFGAQLGPQCPVSGLTQRQKLLDSLAETWDFFFSDVLPMLQAIFYPVQGKEPSVRQLALLHFRNAITLSVKLEDALARAHARVPPAIVQMLLVLQGVHESRGVTEDYLRLEMLVQKVVSPYLGTYGLHSSEGPFAHSCILEKRLLRRSRSGDVLAKNPVVRSKSYNTPLLNPVQEHEAEGAAAGGPSIRRHSVSEMTSCPEPQGFSDPPGQGSAGAFRSSPAPHSGPCPSRLYPTTQPPEQGLDPTRSSLPHASPENLVDQILESVDSDSEGIFIDFGRGRGSGVSNLEGSGGRQSVV